MFLTDYLVRWVLALRLLATFATHFPFATKAFGGVRFIVMMPVRFPSACRRYIVAVRNFRANFDFKALQFLAVTVIRLQRFRVPMSWVTQFNVLCRQFSRLTP